jgi:hypothetical protein
VRYAAWFVDVNTQHKVVARPDCLPVNQLKSLSRRNSFDDFADRLSVKLDHCPQEKKWAKPTFAASTT